MRSKEQQTPFEKEVLRAEKSAKVMMVSLMYMKQKLEDDDFPGAYLEAFDFADASEKLTLLARDLPSCTGNPQAQKMSEQVIADNMPIRIGFTKEGWFGVVIPSLLPKKQKGSVDYIRDALYKEMGNFFKGKNPVRYTDCYIVYRHIYKKDRPERRYRDHDNIEINAVTDIIALYVLFDDSPLCCSHLYCSAAGDENRTEIFVVPQSEIVKWILDVKSKDSKAVILYENLP